MGGYEAIMQVLTSDESVDVSAKDILGQTALLLAAQHGHVDVVRTLLDHDCVVVVAEDIDGDMLLSIGPQRGG